MNTLYSYVILVLVKQTKKDMATITTRIPDELDKTLSNISSEIDRNKGYIVKKAIENYLETKGDILIALARIEREEEVISLEDIERKYDLAD